MEVIDPSRLVLEQTARDSYSRLVAYLAARSRDIAAAEDALGDAFLAALKTWPQIGVPEKPEAWLLTAAHRKLIDRARHSQVHQSAMPTLIAMADEAQKVAESEALFPDERLKLLFTCAHPAIDRGVRTALMLQTVLSLDAARIASAFLVKPSAMGQRLFRAKAKIRDAGIRFDVPETAELPPRLNAVLEAIYAAYGSGYDDVSGSDPRRKGLAMEAIDLGGLLLRLMPDEPEPHGLMALMLYCEARRGARRNTAGEYVPLSEQDTATWSRPMIAEAQRCLAAASSLARIGPFQLEAAIQSIHSQRLWTGETDWEAVALLYEGLVRLAPTTGALVGRAAAIGEARGADAGWKLLRAIPSEAVNTYQPYWALTAHLLKRMRRFEEAASAYQRAIGLCEDPAPRAF